MPIQRTEKEIREHIAALTLLSQQPCDCHLYGAVHEMKCVVGGKMMAVAIDHLKWILGESADAQERVDRLNENAAKLRAELKGKKK